MSARTAATISPSVSVATRWPTPARWPTSKNIVAVARPLVMAASGGVLLQRIRRLLVGAPMSHAGRGPVWLAGITALVLVAGIGATVVITAPRTELRSGNTQSTPVPAVAPTRQVRQRACSSFACDCVDSDVPRERPARPRRTYAKPDGGGDSASSDKCAVRRLRRPRQSRPHPRPLRTHSAPFAPSAFARAPADSSAPSRTLAGRAERPERPLSTQCTFSPQRTSLAVDPYVRLWPEEQREHELVAQRRKTRSQVRRGVRVQ